MIKFKILFLIKLIFRIIISYSNHFYIRYYYGYNESIKKIYQLINGKTIYILGTGASVNDYNNKDWDEINENISIGINYWFLHEFVPDIIQIELISSKKTYYSELIIHIMNKRKNEFKNTIFLIKSNYLLWHKYSNLNWILKNIPKELRKNIIFSKDFPNIASNLNEFKMEYSILNKIRFFERNSIFKYDVRASLGYCTSLLIQNKVEKIILCGVDLNNGYHFYDKKTSYYNKLYEIYLDEYEEEGTHQTEDKNFFELTISEVIYFFNEKFENKLIFLKNKTSTLYPKVKIFNESS